MGICCRMASTLMLLQKHAIGAVTLADDRTFARMGVAKDTHLRDVVMRCLATPRLLQTQLLMPRNLRLTAASGLRLFSTVVTETFAPVGTKHRHGRQHAHIVQLQAGKGTRYPIPAVAADEPELTVSL